MPPAAIYGRLISQRLSGRSGRFSRKRRLHGQTATGPDGARPRRARDQPPVFPPPPVFAKRRWDTYYGTLHRRRDRRKPCSKQDGGSHYHHSEQYRRHVDKAGIDERQNKHNDRPQRPGQQKNLVGYPMNHAYIPITAQRQAFRNQTGYRNGKPGGGNGIQRDIDVVCRFKISISGFIDILQRNFKEKRTDDLGQYCGGRQDQCAVQEALLLRFGKKVSPLGLQIERRSDEPSVSGRAPI